MEKRVIERLRQPHPEQEAIDARSAQLLRSSQRYSAASPRRERQAHLRAVGLGLPNNITLSPKDK